MTGVSIIKVLVGMSGGVDSSAAALLLKRSGHEVVGCTALLTQRADGCGAQRDIEDARTVCTQLGIEHIAIDLRNEFEKQVIDRFCSEYLAGRTPNPCVECNRFIKFGILLDYALNNGFDRIATGHYAAVSFDENSGLYALEAVPCKDQSYFLCRLGQRELSHTLFPLAGLDKPQVRQLALDAGLTVHSKVDSQDICFIDGVSVSDYITAHTGKVSTSGFIIDSSGRQLSQHDGISGFTIGQRKGLGGGFPQPMFVQSIDPDSGNVRIGTSAELFHSRVFCSRLSFCAGHVPSDAFTAKVKLRFAMPAAEAAVTLSDGGAYLDFLQPQRAPAPGQTAVFYNGSTVLGGGVIERVCD